MSFGNWNPQSFGTGTVGKLFAGILAGLGVGTLVPPEPVTLPVVGTVSGLVAGTVGLVFGTGLFLRARRSSSGCGCSGDCDC